MEAMQVYHLTIQENGHSRRFVYEDRDEALTRFADAIAAGLDAKLDEVVRAPPLPTTPTEWLPDEPVPVRHQGELLGALSLERKPGESLTPTEQPLLADKGLAAALESQARKGSVPTEVRSEGVGRYPRDVESAVYFCALEALNNVVKYAGATRAEVRLAEADGELTFEVSDDGDGFDPAQTGYGTGLQGMADRLYAIGGTLKVHSQPGKGAQVTGRVPV